MEVTDLMKRQRGRVDCERGDQDLAIDPGVDVPPSLDECCSKKDQPAVTAWPGCRS